ncbi:hypothetical protein HYG77_04945 [Rhodococcus sp. ZPP]|uniref:hypothetical protein n=1 Tax=Rhodococcus sp. ZPP TaxID=2749906 RepID=UPI001AD891A2|nr:hypothetical protein [Rhodococcus sp. ZPP]QTJ65010.1 hypothetical protein HYG77_04945 [Rhodococcus sp. ZPP]
MKAPQGLIESINWERSAAASEYFAQGDNLRESVTDILEQVDELGYAVVKLAEKHTTDPDWRMDFLNELSDYQAWFVSGMFAGRWSDEEFKKILELARITFPDEPEEPDVGDAADRARDAAIDQQNGVL